VKFKISVFEPI